MSYINAPFNCIRSFWFTSGGVHTSFSTSSVICFITKFQWVCKLKRAGVSVSAQSSGSCRLLRTSNYKNSRTVACGKECTAM
jgi:hypothetical protein